MPQPAMHCTSTGPRVAQAPPAQQRRKVGRTVPQHVPILQDSSHRYKHVPESWCCGASASRVKLDWPQQFCAGDRQPGFGEQRCRAALRRGHCETVFNPFQSSMLQSPTRLASNLIMGVQHPHSSLLQLLVEGLRVCQHLSLAWQGGSARQQACHPLGLQQGIHSLAPSDHGRCQVCRRAAEAFLTVSGKSCACMQTEEYLMSGIR